MTFSRSRWNKIALRTFPTRSRDTRVSKIFAERVFSVQRFLYHSVNASVIVFNVWMTVITFDLTCLTVSSSARDGFTVLCSPSLE